MIGNLQCVVLDCPDALALARFYQVLVGGEVNRPDRRWSLDEQWATLHTDTGLVLAFQGVDDYHPPQWPDPTRPQQFHLDIDVADLDEAYRQVVALGATLLDDAQSWRIYADPAGHPFCLVPESPAN
ncbi:VOC family protein [Streptosporangium sp. KLBMP 9127]|nr:VOC family protein [Streptosporangium sp. KLBMP 9127]